MELLFVLQRQLFLSAVG